MSPRTIALFGAAILAVAAPAAAFAIGDEILMKPWETIHCDSPEVEANEAAGLDPYTHSYPDPTADDPLRTVTLHLLCATEPIIELMTDCTATGYSFTGWRWNVAENFYNEGGAGISASTAQSIFSASGNRWDNQDAFNMYGSQGTSSGTVPSANGVNLFDWGDLASNVIASTWTWSSSGIASESDARYNTDFGWSSSGAAGKMDLENIATHELGHTFGLGHSTSGTCLTMYPSGSLGETQKRSLGDGDIRGIQARY